MRKAFTAAAFITAAFLMTDGVSAQSPARTAPAPLPNPDYGAPITPEQAKAVMAAAQAEAARRNVHPSIAIVDLAGELVLFEKAANAPYNAFAFANAKARSAARLKRPTKFDMDRLNGGNQSIHFLPDAFPFGGGYPIFAQGKVIGAIGVTNGADEEVAQAGIAAIK